MGQLRQRGRGLIRDGLHGDRAPATHRAVRGDQHARVSVGQPLADRFRAEAREQWHGNRAELGARQQGDRVLDHQGQVKADGHATLDTDRAQPGRGLLDRVLQLRIGQLPDRPRLGLADERDAAGIRPAMAEHGRVVRIEESARKPAGEGQACGCIHHGVVGPGPDDAELLDQCVPKPVGVPGRLLAQLRIGRALMRAHKAPEPAALHLLAGR